MSATFIHAIIRDEFRISTWLLAGACVQTALVLFLPRKIALIPAVLLLAARGIHTALMTYGIIRDPSLDAVLKGRHTAQIPNEYGEFAHNASDKEVAVFMLGARSSHALGKLAPGFKELGDYLETMWEDAEANREKWGFLGRSAALLSTDAEASNSMITISYWRSAGHLHAFARGAAHRKGWDWFQRSTKQHPHLGIMHELYSVPAGHWENTYLNFNPFCMGRTQHVVPSEDDVASQLRSNLIPANGSRWKSMHLRMGHATDPEAKSE